MKRWAKFMYCILFHRKYQKAFPIDSRSRQSPWVTICKNCEPTLWAHLRPEEGR